MDITNLISRRDIALGPSWCPQALAGCLGVVLRPPELDVWEPEVLLLHPTLVTLFGAALGPGWSDVTVRMTPACLRPWHR